MYLKTIIEEEFYRNKETFVLVKGLEEHDLGYMIIERNGNEFEVKQKVEAGCNIRIIGVKPLLVVR